MQNEHKAFQMIQKYSYIAIVITIYYRLINELYADIIVSWSFTDYVLPNPENQERGK